MARVFLQGGVAVDEARLCGFGTVVLPSKGRPGHHHQWEPLTPPYSEVMDALQETAGSIIVSRDLSWLLKHHFIAATWTHIGSQELEGDGLVLIRIYLIPEDLQGDGQSFIYSRHASISKSLKHMDAMLSCISRDPNAWNASSLGPFDFTYFSKDANTRSLVDIYQSLPSPQPNPEIMLASSSSSPNVVSRAFDRYTKGLETILHAYQKRSLARMLEAELPSQPPIDITPSPLFLQLPCVSSHTPFFINPARWVCRRQCPEQTRPRGGILCENMGVGKTLICLALILSSVDHVSQPDNLGVSDSVYGDANDKEQSFETTSVAGERVQILQSYGAVRSLETMALQAFRATPYPVPWRHQSDSLPLHIRPPDHLLYRMFASEFQPFYYPSQSKPSKATNRPSRGPHKGTIPKIYITNSTLVIVPPNLLGHWKSEIQKHVKDGALRVMYVETKEPLPDSSRLANEFDVVLMTSDRFVLEMRDKKLNKRGLSPLRGVHWLRLMVDEGNICANASNAMLEARQLKAERRWIVTGTPTTNLVSLGNESDIISDSDETAIDTDLSGTSDDDTPTSQYSWTASDRSDLNKLSSMICGFLRVQITPMIGGIHQMMGLQKPETDLFADQIIAPVFSHRWGAVQVLYEFISRLMIRHQYEDIEKEVKLPPKTQENVILEMDEFQRIAFNVMQATLAVNAIDSERQDRDYIFHPENRVPKAQFVANTFRACFWHRESEFFDTELANHVKRAKHSIQTAIERGASEADVELVSAAYQVHCDASKNSLWRSMMQKQDVPFRLQSFPIPHQASWLRLDHASYWQTHDPARHACLSTDIFAIRKAGKECLLDEDRMVVKGTLERKKELARIAQVNLELWGKPVPIGEQQAPVATPPTSPSQVPSEQGNENPRPLPRIKSPNGKAKAKTNAGELAADTTADRKLARSVSADRTIHDRDGIVIDCVSPDNKLLQTCVKNSTSPKLNFIIAEVLRHSSDKFLVFSASIHALAQIRTGLEVARVSALMLSGQSRHESRNCAQTFETSMQYRVLLLDLKTGARGLNLVSANRIIFVEPVWLSDVESQAIKRVHRIGQQRAVHIITLAMRGTVEEEMLNRKRRNDQTDKVLEKDEIMIKYMANPKFLHPAPLGESDLRADVDIPLFLLENRDRRIPAVGHSSGPSTSTWSEPSRAVTPAKRGPSDEQDAQNTLLSPPAGPPRKRIRLVTFGGSVINKGTVLLSVQ